MNIAVLGCGPAGLIAAHAVEQLGHSAHIISKKQKSNIPGSQHLQDKIPGLTPVYPEFTVEFVRLGTEQGYAQKVYGDPTHPCGWQAYRGLHPSWSVFNAYDILWERYEDRIQEGSVDQSSMSAILANYDLVVSTIPQPGLCLGDGHVFDGVPYYIKPLEIHPDDHNREVVVWNGLSDDHWYRWSILGSRCSLESTQPMLGALAGTKAIYSNCTCWPDLIRVGRWAKWRHGVLLHHVYTDIITKIKEA